MEEKDILKLIDHTQLQPNATWEDIVSLCDEAVKYGTATVCIPATYLKRVHDKYGDNLKLCTVIGFPLGYNSANSKVTEAKDAIADGASEIDTVVNISDVKNHRYDEVKKEFEKRGNFKFSFVYFILVQFSLVLFSFVQFSLVLFVRKKTH